MKKTTTLPTVGDYLTKTEALEIVERHVSDLMEHFDSVQIFATLPQSDPLESAFSALRCGAGNWYARYGNVCEWVEQQKERARIQEHDDDDETPELN